MITFREREHSAPIGQVEPREFEDDANRTGIEDQRDDRRVEPFPHRQRWPEFQIDVEQSQS